ncbi:MAG: sigma-70 family RNA polymerase sigma factor [Pseudobacteriovorax sp.]|nr:sigma-70 family RNA polymerase sigma factor [Pseudobacteriovorax sp.]
MGGSNENELRWKELFLKTQKGDKKAYNQLLVEISRYVKVCVRRSFSNEQIAEEVCQEILIAFHKAKHTYDPDKAFKPWLAAIIRFKTIDHLRRAYRKKEKEVFPASDETILDAPTNIDFDTGIDLERILKGLPEKQRKAFQLLKLKGLSVKEAAAETGWSESNVKVSAHRAYKLLRKALLEEGI